MDRKESRAKDFMKVIERFRSRKIGNNVRRRLNFGDENQPDGVTSSSSIMADYNESVRQQAKQLEEKYNFDFIGEKPVQGGNYTWEKQDDPQNSQVPEFYFRPPHPRPAFRDLGDVMTSPQEVSHNSPPGDRHLRSDVRRTCRDVSSNSMGSNDNKPQSQHLQKSHTLTTQCPSATTSRVTTTASSIATVTRQLFPSVTSSVNRPQCSSSVRDSETCESNLSAEKERGDVKPFSIDSVSDDSTGVKQGDDCTGVEQVDEDQAGPSQAGDGVNGNKRKLSLVSGEPNIYNFIRNERPVILLLSFRHCLPSSGYL